MITVLTVIGTRPEAIKLAPVLRVLQKQAEFRSVVCLTGQHADLVRPVLDFFGITVQHDLGIMGEKQSLTVITQRVLTRIGPILIETKPDWVLVQGDTTSAFAGALAAFYQQIPVAHVEAGLRTQDRYKPFPEEINRRLLTDLATVHFAPTAAAAAALRSEGIAPGAIVITGNTIVDALNIARQRPFDPSGGPLRELVSATERLVVVTAHRRENRGEGIAQICRAVQTILESADDIRIVWPVHPAPDIADVVYPALGLHPRFTLLPPLGYPEFIWLLERAVLVLTDSGGLQEEAVALGKRVLILRDETERPEVVDGGWGTLVGTAPERIVPAALAELNAAAPTVVLPNPFGDGHAAARIRRYLQPPAGDPPGVAPQRSARAAARAPSVVPHGRGLGAGRRLPLLLPPLPPRQPNPLYLTDRHTILVVTGICSSEADLALDRAGRGIISLDGTGTRRLVGLALEPSGESTEGAPVPQRREWRHAAGTVVALPLYGPTPGIHEVADAILREARFQSASVIVALEDGECAYAALLAARRIGVPFVAARAEERGRQAAKSLKAQFGDETVEVNELVGAEADAVIRAPSGARDLGDGRAFVETLGRAREHHVAARQIGRPSRSLRDIRIALIADEFTVDTFGAEVTTVQLTPDNALEIFDNPPVDALIIESAWHGISNRWKGVINSRRRPADSLARFINGARQRGIPVIFWNKEDPVHFDQFLLNAGLCDHIFTTDAASIPGYVAQRSGRVVRTISSSPFAAQPSLHNPLGGSDWDPTVCFAGTFFGDRFPRRSELHAAMLDVGATIGLTIYDRQRKPGGTKYSFPECYEPYVRDGLTYDEMVRAYRQHPLHINVNSVEESPTMCARRVVELAACGVSVVSGPGKAVQELFAGDIPIVEDADEASDRILTLWQDEEKRFGRVWSAYRRVMRAHLLGQRLAEMLRTAGLRIDAPALPPYALLCPTLTPAIRAAIERQTVLPALLITGDPEAGTIAGVPVMTWDPGVESELIRDGVGWIGWLDEVRAAQLANTHYEDLIATRWFDQSNAIGVVDAPNQRWARVLVPHASLELCGSLLRLGTVPLTLAPSPQSMNGLGVCAVVATDLQRQSLPARVRPAKLPVVAFAGYDFKFAHHLIDRFRVSGHRVIIDPWHGPAGHDLQRSDAVSEQADILFCEWGRGNAVWYSRHKRPQQRLFVRIHRFEIESNELAGLDVRQVDGFLFVGENVRDAAIRRFGFPPERCHVVPNYVLTDQLDLPKHGDVRHSLGFVGYLPQHKRIDLAFDLIADLRRVDSRFHLHVRGKRPEELTWVARSPGEMTYFAQQFARQASDPLLKEGVTSTAHGYDMAEWYRRIGFGLSVSDVESFHLTIADSAASGAVPLIQRWPGVEQVYPAEWSDATLTDVRDRALRLAALPEREWSDARAEVRRWVRDNCSLDRVYQQMAEIVLNDTVPIQ